MQDIEARKQQSSSSWVNGLFLLVLWLGVNLGDRLWLRLDQSIPAWDEANHLTGSLNYLSALLQFPGWTEFWQVSNKFPPLTYLLSVPFQLFLGKGSDQALWVNLVFSGLLLWAVYGIGQRLFNAEVGRWSAAIAILMPRFVYYRLHFITDIGLTTLTLLCFACLTHWYFAEKRLGQWGWIIGFGCCLGLALMTKQTCLFFLFFPMLYAAIASLWQKKWEKVLQLLVSGFVSIPIWWGWYRTNFIYLFSTYERANVTAATNEGDPALNTLKAWIYYWQDLPKAVSWLLLIVPLVGLALHLLKRFPIRKTAYNLPEKDSLIWLGVYFLGAYFLFSALYNKDSRYIMPYLPVVAIFLGYGLTQWRGKWVAVRWFAFFGATILAVARLFPLPVVSNFIAPTDAPDAKRYPHPQVIEAVIKSEPYLRNNIGVIPSLGWLNHNNINYFGALREFQVYGRELGSREEQVAQDGNSFDWLLTKTGENSNAKKTQLALAETLRKDEDFSVQNQWNLPDDSILRLYHRQKPLVTVAHFDQIVQPVKLDLVELPETTAIAGQPVPVTYHWSGNWQDLEKGTVLLTWSNGEQFWLHDHGLAFGMLHEGQLTAAETGDRFGIVEQTAMLPPQDFPAGTYTLQAVYLDSETGETRPISLPKTSITLQAAPNNAEKITPLQLVELDWLSQLRAIAPDLGTGIAGLDPVFSHVERLNQYDPEQDYLQQTEVSLAYRLGKAAGINTPQIRDWYYTKVLAHALQEEAPEVIATLETLRDLDPENPFIHAYIAFVSLYQWQPKQAEIAIQPALKIAPEIPEIQALSGAAALLQGKVFQAWSVVKTLQAQGFL
ncbi:MAG: glycosyltransferase family 39 protein [Limnothrix sp.]